MGLSLFSIYKTLKKIMHSFFYLIYRDFTEITLLGESLQIFEI